MTRGIFVTFEGGEGTGKSTLAKGLAAWLRACGCDVVLTREPGGCPSAEVIRSWLMTHQAPPLSSMTEYLLMAAARHEHLKTVLEPALKRGSVVLCDRFIDSSFVYNGLVGGCSVDAIKAIHQIVNDGLMPDMTFFLDLAVDDALARVQRRTSKDLSVWDQKPASYHQAIREGFQQLARMFSDRITTLDASLPPELLERAARGMLAQRYPELITRCAQGEREHA